MGESLEEIVKVRNLGFKYPDGTTLKFDGRDFTVGRGERVVMLGPNGSGKSTLLSLLLGLLKPSEGEIEVLGVDPSKEYEKIRERIGALLQNVDLQIIAPRVWDDVSFSPRNYGYKEEETARLVDDILKKLEIEHLKDKVPHYLSGGEKTKVGLAGALVIKPELLILDEPFEHIDPACRTELIKLLNRVNKENGTAIIQYEYRPADRGHGIFNCGRGQYRGERDAQGNFLSGGDPVQMPYRAPDTGRAILGAQETGGRNGYLAHGR